MLGLLVHIFATRLLFRLGLVACFAGLIPTSMMLIDQLSCAPAMAQIEGIQSDRVAIQFAASNGRSVNMWAPASKIGLHYKKSSDARLPVPVLHYGDSPVTQGLAVRILYRGADGGVVPYVTHPFSLQFAGLGLAVTIVGLVMLLLRHIVIRSITLSTSRSRAFAVVS
jgi:hypothetical protein